MARVGRKYLEIIKEIVAENPGTTAGYVYDEMLDRPYAKWCPTRIEVKYLLRCTSEIRGEPDTRGDIRYYIA